VRRAKAHREAVVASTAEAIMMTCYAPKASEVSAATSMAHWINGHTALCVPLLTLERVWPALFDEGAQPF
jgi:hypothetical protein